MNIDTEFGKYIREYECFSTRLDRLYAEAPDMTVGDVIKWMRAAYQQGAYDMAQDTLDTLGDYACAVAGINHISYTSEQGFDSARENLAVYYAGVFDEHQD